MRSALIIGSEGQDGTLLKRLLIRKNYKVWGLGRNNCNTLSDLAGYIQFDLAVEDYTLLLEFIKIHQPDEIYYVSAFHHSSQEIHSGNSYDFISKSVKVNQTGFIKILEIIKNHSLHSKVFYTSSSLIFSGTSHPVQTEETVPEPRCIYSVTKCGAMEAAKYYRSEHGVFVSVGIMYNHESVLRKDHFLSKKIINESRLLKENKISSIEIGDLAATTDWGYAPDYVEAMWHLLQQEIPGVFIISSGKAHTVQNWFEVLFHYLNLGWKQYVKENPSMILRKKPVRIGDNSKLLSTGWKPKVSFEEMVIKMYNNII